MEMLCLILLAALGAGWAMRAGPYVIIVNSLLEYSPPSPDQVDFLFYIQQLNISHRVIKGKMTVKKDTGPLLLYCEIVYWTDNGFKSVSGKGETVPACVLPSYTALLASFHPQAGFDRTACSFGPGEYELRDLDFDSILHIDSPIGPYGRTIIRMDYVTKTHQKLFGFRVDNEFVSLEAYEYENGRGDEYQHKYGK